MVSMLATAAADSIGQGTRDHRHRPAPPAPIHAHQRDVPCDATSTATRLIKDALAVPDEPVGDWAVTKIHVDSLDDCIVAVSGGYPERHAGGNR
jgi:hypothetical protein